jgi:hypothetical protein
MTDIHTDIYDDISSRSSKRDVLQWFENQDDETKEAIMDSSPTRVADPQEKAEVFLARVHVRRTVNQVIDRYNRRAKAHQ